MPRWATRRSPERQTFGYAVACVAARMGMPLMPWQQEVALVGGELLPNGLPAYRDVVVTVPRQNGKTVLVLSWELQRTIGWDHLGPQRVAYSAQSGADARKKLVEDQMPLLQSHKRALGIKRFLRGMGNEAVEFTNGSRIVLLSSDVAAGHGKTIDLGLKDELWADADDRRDQALVPAMATRAHAQVLTTSTMGTDESVALNRAVERGREAAERGLTTGTAYFEWSAPEDADPDDPAVWWGCMPALGFTLTEDVVRHARSVLSLSEFRRAFLNIKDGRRADPVISPQDWAACHDPAASIVGPLALAFDVTPDRSAAAIAASGTTADGRALVEITGNADVFDHRNGTGWVVPRLVELVERQKPSLVVCDAAGAAGALLADLTAAGIDVRVVTTREATHAAGAFYDDVAEHRLRHIGQPELTAAVDGADRRIVGDSWLWDRKSSATDISPLVAATLARWAHKSADDFDPAQGVW